MKATFLEELRSRDLHALAEYSKNCPAETARAAVAKGRADSLEDLAALISPAAEAELVIIMALRAAKLATAAMVPFMAAAEALAPGLMEDLSKAVTVENTVEAEGDQMAGIIILGGIA